MRPKSYFKISYYGNFSIVGYPRILGHLETDANTFANWEVDYVKLDRCYSHLTDMDKGYLEFRYQTKADGLCLLLASLSDLQWDDNKIESPEARFSIQYCYSL